MEQEDSKRLLDEFREHIKNHSLSRQYYDEDDLVMVFDLASDEEDLYTQLNVLMLGKKLYPDSELLEMRMGFVLDQSYSRMSFNNFLGNNTFRRGVIWDILRMKAESIPDEALPGRLDKFVKTHKFDDDEDIIQFINLITYYEQEHWLAANYENFISKCNYRDTALSEVGHALESEAPEISIKLLEELSNIEPFNVETWAKLASLHEAAGHAQEGLQAVDYAKALSPEDPFIKFTEARLLLAADPRSERAGELLREFLEIFPDSNLAKSKLAALYVAQEKPRLATELYGDEVEDSIQGDEINLQGTVEMLMNIGNRDNAVELMRDFDQRYGIYSSATLYITLLYERMMFNEILSFIDRKRPEGSPALSMEPIALLMFVASLLRLGRNDEASEMARYYLTRFDDMPTDLNDTITLAGPKIVLHYIRAMAARGDFDPTLDPLVEAMK